jgi:2-methylisocitrate lyase-like PEP mutase family enzyme
MDRGAKLRELVARDELLMAIGGWDALTARMAQQAGAEAVYMSGSCVSSSVHGGPDIGLTTMTEMVRRARQMASVLDVPLIADGDTGYGNEMNVHRTVKEYERSGVNAIQMEDQRFPKRCGHFEGKSLVDPADFAAKVVAATDARESDDFQIIARTDALATDGLDKAIRRANLYKEAGADVLFMEAPTEREQMERICREAPGPLLANLAAKGKTPPIHAEELADIGYDLAIYPSDSFKAALKTIQDTYETLIDERSQENILDGMVEWGERDEITEMGDVQASEEKYAAAKKRYADVYEEL